jgi:hypothetical protein
MTQYVINIGALPNDGTGDPLRTAFNETNLNFDQVFAAGPVLSNIQIANNKILTTNTNGNLILAPNGVGVVQSNVSIVPNTANIRNLGSADRRWSTLYIQYANISGAITVADLTATGNVTVGGNLSVTGNVINIGNIVTDAKTIQLANTAGTANAATGSGITVGANDAIATFLFNSANNAWNTNIGLNVTGNIVPSGNAVYSLGNATNQWNDLYVSNATIFMNNVPISLGAGNVLTVNGEDVVVASNTGLVSVSSIDIGTTNFLVGDDDYLVFEGLVPGGIRPAETDTYNLGNVGKIWSEIHANVYYGNGSQLTGLNTSSISNGNSSVDIPVADGNITVTANGTYTWSFDTAGNLTLPQGGTVSEQANPDGFPGHAIVLTPTTTIDPTQQLWVYPTGGSDYNHLHLTSGNLYNTELFLGNDNLYVKLANTGNIVVNTNDNGGNFAQWTFDTTGNINLPTNGSINFNAGGIVQAADEDFTILVQDADDDGFRLNLNVDDGAGNVLSSYQQQRDQFELGFPSTSVYYQFNDNGTVVLPSNAAVWTDAGSNLSIIARSVSDSSYVEMFTQDNTDTMRSTFRLTRDTANIVTSSGAYTWSFDSAGNLTLPGGMTVSGNTNTLGTQTALLQPTDDLPLSFISSGANGTVTTFWAEDFGNLMASNIAAIYTPLQNTQTVRIVTGTNGGNVAIYDFDKDGMFTTAAVCATGNVYAGNVSATGNITGNYFIGNGSQLTGLPEQYGNANVATFLAAYGSNTISTTGNITAGNFVAPASTANRYVLYNDTGVIGGSAVFTFDENGNTLSIGTTAGTLKVADISTPQAGVNLRLVPSTGLTYSYGNFLPLFANTYDLGNSTNRWNNMWSNVANTVTANTVTLSASGNVTGGNVLTAGQVSATGNITGNYFIGNGSQLTGLASSYGDANVATFLAAYGSNSISTTGNITAGNLIGNISLIGNVTGTTANVTLVAGVYSTVFDNTGLATFPGSLVTPPVPFANLTAVAGARAFVNNANLVATGNFGSQISGGGANTVPVWSDGSNWYIG